MTKQNIVTATSAKFIKLGEKGQWEKLRVLIKELLEKYGHVLLPLPPYSPDFNPIEQTFGILKRRRQFIGQSDMDALFLSES